MELSEDECEFSLTQEPVREFCETQSYQYGINVVENENVVSLDSNLEPNFDVNASRLLGNSENEVCDSIAIEDISEDEGGVEM